MIARLRTWLRSLVADAPADDLGSLDVRDGVRVPSPVAPFSDWEDTRPVGECPPMTEEQADRLLGLLHDVEDAPLPVRSGLTSIDYAIARQWGLDLAGTAEVDR